MANGDVVDTVQQSTSQIAEIRAAASVLIERIQFMRQAGISFQGMRDLYEVLGYDRVITNKQYRDRYARGGIAGRIIDALPKATWRGGGELVEDEDPKVSTAFEKAWETLNTKHKIWSVFQRADILSGLSTYSVILIGGLGELDQELPRGNADSLLYLTPFSGGGGPGLNTNARTAAIDADCTIMSYDVDTKSPRFGLPLTYQLRRVTASTPDFQRPVHWSRIIHIAEGILDDEVFGQPGLERVWNLLDDLDKVTGGGAEAFWLRANQGLQLDVDKDMDLSAAEKQTLKDQADEYQHQLRRMLRTRGVTVKELGSDTANFSNPADAVLTQIAGSKGIPKRILTGSEMGELASSQDRDNWKDQVNGRQTEYAGPYIVRPLVDRLIAYGYLPTPAKGPEAYEVKWPHIQVLTEAEKSAGAKEWGDTATSEGSVFTRDEIRDKWYSMPPLPKPVLDQATGVHTSPKSGLPVDPKVDPETGLPFSQPPAPEIAVDPLTGLPVEVDTKTGLPAHQVQDLSPEEQAKKAAKARADRARQFPRAAEEPYTFELEESERELLRVLEEAVRVNNLEVIDQILGTRHAGGPGSGNYGHAGRPGEQGGSAAEHDTRVFTTYFDPKKIQMIAGQAPELSQRQMTKLHEAFSTIDDYLHDPEIGGELWAVLSGFTPESLHEHVEAMRSGLRGIYYRVPGQEHLPVYENVLSPDYKASASAEQLNAALEAILQHALDPETGVIFEKLLAAAIKDGSWRRFVSRLRAAGGPGSGNFGHAGRPGEQGGSAPNPSEDNMEPWKSSGGFEHTGIVWKQPTDPTTGRPIPIKVDTVEEAARLVLDGKVVEVKDVATAHTLINKLAEMAAQAKADGKDARDYDLCQVSVAGSNMFCSESLRTKEYPNGVPRLEMPQLGGKPVPGSEADKLPRNPWDPSEVDGSTQFIAHLQGVGVKTERDVMAAADLRASQRELVGSKVGKMMNDKSFDPAKNPIFISNDNYVVDGHHRWAAVVGRDAEDGHLGDAKMNVIRVNAPISEVLHLANAWSQKFGIQQAAGVTRQAKATGLHHS